MVAKSTFDLFATLRALDSGNLSVYEGCTTDEQRKDFNKEVGWMLPQWMSSAANPKQQIELIRNMSRVTSSWGALNNHPYLRTQLLATTGLGKTVKHRFPKSKKAPGYGALHKLLLLSYPDIRLSEVDIWCKNNNIKEVEQLARNHGLQPKELDPIIKVFKKITGVR